MSRWTHIIGSFYIETNVETDNLKSYIEDQLKIAKKITKVKYLTQHFL